MVSTPNDDAAATGERLARRAIAYAGPHAGVGVEGLLETFLSNSTLSKDWIARIIDGIRGAKGVGKDEGA